MKAAVLCLVTTAALLVGTTHAVAQPPRYYLPPSVGGFPSIGPPSLYTPKPVFPSTYYAPSVSPAPSFGGFVITNRGASPYFTYGAGAYGPSYTSRYYFGGHWYYR